MVTAVVVGGARDLNIYTRRSYQFKVSTDWTLRAVQRADDVISLSHTRVATMFLLTQQILMRPFLMF